MVYLKLIDHLQTAIDRSTAVFRATAEAVAEKRLVAYARGDCRGVSKWSWLWRCLLCVLVCLNWLRKSLCRRLTTSRKSKEFVYLKVKENGTVNVFKKNLGKKSCDGANGLTQTATSSLIPLKRQTER